MRAVSGFDQLLIKIMNKTIPYLSVIRVEGDDAGAFLQSQLSADIAAIGVGENTLACYCTPKGKVLGLLLVGRIESAYLLAGSSDLLPGIVQRLRMFVMRSRVVFSEDPELKVTANPGPEYGFSENAEELEDAEAWRATELQAGIAWLNTDSADSFIPQMLGFEDIGAVSFQKGCYPGQEIVARARYLGKVKRKPVIVQAIGAPAPVTGEKVRLRRGEDWSGGTVVDSASVNAQQLVVFTVAPAEPEIEVEEVEIAGQSYRCATT